MDHSTNLNHSSLAGVLRQSCARFASRPAILALDQSPLSFAELYGQIQSVRNQLQQAGVSPGHRVAVMVPQGPEQAVLCLAIMTCATCVPIDPALSPRELQALVNQSDIDALVTVPALLPISDALALPRWLLVAGERAGEADIQPEKTFRLEAPGGYSPGVNSAPALILRTSGSTAAPKLVPLSEKNLLASAQNITASLGIDHTDRCLNMMLQFHIGALLDLLIAPLVAGGSVIIGRDMSPHTFYRIVKELEPTWFQAVPTLFAEILAIGQSDYGAQQRGSLRFCRAVSARLPEQLRLDISAFFSVPVIEIYGMTETAGVIASNSIDTSQHRDGSVGRAAGTEMAILDGSGNLARPGRKGEILVRGDNVFTGYAVAPGDSDERGEFIGGWFRTGDEGYLDEDGYLFITGRIKDVINRGGEKISPLEVDLALMSHPAILDAACFARPHDSLGEEIYAAIVVAPGIASDDHTLRSFLAEKVSAYKIPRRLFRCDHIPRTAGGKLQRRLVADFCVAGAARDNQAQAKSPQSPLAKLIARMWKEILQLEAVSTTDNFFELGGDSLKAARFIQMLESHLDLVLEPGALFDFPVLEDLEKYIGSLRENGQSVVNCGSSYLPQAVFRELHRQMASWSGQRSSADSLVVGYNTLGTLPPLFWCGSDQNSLAEIAAALGTDQPLYGMRSLLRLKGRDSQNNLLLARHLVDEIVALQPQGPYFLGGFCEGGKVICMVGDLLRSRGAQVNLQFLVEYVNAEPINGRLCLVLSCNSKYSPFRFFSEPEPGLAKLADDGVSIFKLPFRHPQFLHNPCWAQVVDILLHELRAVQQGQPSASLYKGKTFTQHLSARGAKAQLSTVCPRIISPGAQLNLQVLVSNSSDTRWQPYDTSGILLTARWRSNHTGKVRVWQAGSVGLPGVLSPHSSASLDLSVTVPNRTGSWTLELDMAEVGVGFFEQRGSGILRLPVLLVPGGDWLSRFMLRNQTTGAHHAF